VLKVKNQRCIAAFFACLVITVFTNTATTVAQTRVAIVDVGLIFKSHPQFTQQLAALKQAADQFKSASVQQQQGLMQKAEGLKQYQPGSDQFKAIETRLAQESATMEVKQRNKMRTLMQQEAQLHYQTYNQVNSMIQTYCDNTGTQLVLRFNSKQMDANEPNSVMQRVNGSVVFHNPKNDITQQIIARLNQPGGTANAGMQQRR
jgi:Skp family chaperone for outer membrane proteins